jgi:GrpB-like predicted nucleotidyltransferase (UPF0157 family)
MEGVERYKVRLLPHSRLWDVEFLEVKNELQKICKDNILDIQHVGSTAISSICAKPILDVAIKLKSIKSMKIEQLKTLGYDYCGAQHGNENYHLFVLRGENQISLRHIHCYDQTEKEFDLLVGFRDYLNAHHVMAVQYEHLKKELADKFPDDRIAYTKGKAEFIQSIYKLL